MANEEQLKILQQGVEVWNQWREEHPEEEIDLREANLHEGNLSEANLRWANLNEANLRGVNLCEADLSGANLSGADLGWANLRWANLNEANLRGVNLNGVTIMEANLKHATLTGVCLYGTGRDNWSIKGVQCDFVFLDGKPFFDKGEVEQKQQWEQEHRVPKDRDFKEGEFEELYRQLSSFTYYFEQGFTPLDPLIMDRVVQAINEQHKEFKLELVNFDKRGQPHATFTVCQMEFVEAAQQQVSTNYESRLAALEGKQEQMMELFMRLANSPKTLELIMGDKRVIEAGRDYLEQVENSDMTTGNSEHKGG